MSFKIKNVAIFLKISIWFLLSRPFGSIIHKKGIPWERFPFAWKYGCSDGTTNGTFLPSGNFSEKRNTLGALSFCMEIPVVPVWQQMEQSFPLEISRKKEYLGSAFLLHGNTGCSDGTTNGTFFPSGNSRKKGIPWERFPFAWKYRSFRCDNKWNSPSHLKGGASERSSAGQGRPDLPTQRVLRNSSVGDDRMGRKSKLQKNPLTKY